MNYHCTKNKTWEDGEEASNTFKKKKKKRELQIFVLYILGGKKKEKIKTVRLDQSWSKQMTILISQSALTAVEIQTEVDAIFI